MTHPLDRELTPWLQKADRTISRRLSDARAHAQAGRHKTAGDRLGELGHDLERMIGQARVSFLRRSAGRKGINFELASEDVARTWPILGRKPQDIRRFAEEALRSLTGASAVAEGTPAGPREYVFKGWEARQLDVFLAQVKGHLSDAQMTMSSVVEVMAREEQEGTDGDEYEDEDNDRPDGPAEAGPEAAAEPGTSASEAAGTGPEGEG